MEGSHAPALAAPKPFGRYELLSQLGTGGMAEVFLARAGGPRNFERLIVIKRILPQFSSNEDFVEMFVEEAKLSALLYHGNIVQVFEFGEIGAELFLAMEYVDGTDLRTVLKDCRAPLPPHLASFIAMQTLHALAYAHTRTDPAGKRLGIVHRDVTPANILLSRGGEVKLCDFGIASVAERETLSGSLKGKFAYVSPEQALGQPATTKSDLFSVGIVLWEALAGQRLFAADSDVATLEQVRTCAIPELTHLTTAADRRLRGVVRRALQFDPSRRHADALTFAEELRQYIVTSGGGDPVATLRELVSSSPRRAPVPRPASRSGVVEARERAVPPTVPTAVAGWSGGGVEMPKAAPPPMPPPAPVVHAVPGVPRLAASPPAPVAPSDPFDDLEQAEPEVRDTLPPDETFAPAANASRSWMWIAAIAVLVVALGAALVVVSGPPDAPPEDRAPPAAASPAAPRAAVSSEVPAPPRESLAAPAPPMAPPAADPSETPPVPAVAAPPAPAAQAPAPANSAAVSPAVPPAEPRAEPHRRRRGPSPRATPRSSTKERLIDPFALGSHR